jgi:phage shock protein PspC (stress-responsive transcriptional regulator)
MQAYQPNLFTRDDTFFGVCEALGEDFGFHPNLLRLPLGIAMLWNPAVILSVYFGLGILVLLTRRLFPNARRAAVAQPALTAAATPAAEMADSANEPELLAAAA